MTNANVKCNRAETATENNIKENKIDIGEQKSVYKGYLGI